MKSGPNIPEEAAQKKIGPKTYMEGMVAGSQNILLIN
jgi:hypothetical protein